MRRHTGAVLVVFAVVAISLSISSTASATQWAVNLTAGSKGEAAARGLPAAPASATAACVSATTKTIKVTWSAVSLATTYDVYQSTTSATSGYVLTASVAAPTVTWTSAALANGTYWYEVAAVIGNNWLGTTSSATAETTIKNGATKCTQP